MRAEDVSKEELLRALNNAITESISAWHDQAISHDVPLNVWLGWTQEEYMRWVEDPANLPASLFVEDDDEPD